MQLALFQAQAAVEPDLRFSQIVRRSLTDGAWVEHQPGWLAGHQRLYDRLRTGMTWRQTTQHLFDRTVATPRRIAVFGDDGVAPPAITQIAGALSQRYGRRFDRISAALYRHGRDSVAWHRDREYRERATAVVAIVSVGAPRRFMLRPYRRSSNDRPRGAALSYLLGWGDLLVMGGTAQRTWEHAVPKVPKADPRLSIMFRHDPDAR